MKRLTPYALLFMAGFSLGMWVAQHLPQRNIHVHHWTNYDPPYASVGGMYYQFRHCEDCLMAELHKVEDK